MKKRYLAPLILSLLIASGFANNFVTMANVFLGEYASQLTAGLPISVSSTNKLQSGLNTKFAVSSTSSTTTNSATDVQMNLMTSTNTLLAGTYLVMFQTTLQSGQNNANIFVSVYANAAQDTSSVLSGTPQIQGGVTPSLNMNVPLNISGFVTIAAGQIIEVRWHTTAGTVTALTRKLSIMGPL